MRRKHSERHSGPRLGNVHCWRVNEDFVVSNRRCLHYFGQKGMLRREFRTHPFMGCFRRAGIPSTSRRDSQDTLAPNSTKPGNRTPGSLQTSEFSCFPGLRRPLPQSLAPGSRHPGCHLLSKNRSRTRAFRAVLRLLNPQQENGCLRHHSSPSPELSSTFGSQGCIQLARPQSTGFFFFFSCKGV